MTAPEKTPLWYQVLYLELGACFTLFRTFFTLETQGPVEPPTGRYSLDMITVTEKAATKINEIAAGDNLTKFAVRLRVLGGGCAGFQYDMYLDDKEPTEMDEVFESQGLRVAVDPMSFQYLDGTEIEYVESEFQTGFKFINPNTKGSCGCGSSFSA